MAERKRIYLSVTEVQHARMFDAANRDQAATLTEWIRAVVMREVAKNERAMAKQPKDYA